MYDKNDEGLIFQPNGALHVYYHEMIRIIRGMCLINMIANTEMMETDDYNFVFSN